MPKRKILLVDDDRDLREAVSECLMNEGYDVAAFAGAMAALDYLGLGAEPALILLDWTMPEMNGEEFYEKLRAVPRLSKIPIVLLTGDVRSRQMAAALGVSGLLDKPFSVDQLLTLVLTIAGQDDSRRNLAG